MRKSIFTLFFMTLSIVSVVQAQTDVCSARVEEALNSVDDICSDLDRNTACYGANAVDSVTVTDPRPADFFVAPGDTGELVDFREISPNAFDPDTGDFGVSLLNVQANIPNTLPGQGVIFLLMGDARLTNEAGEDIDGRTPFQSFFFVPGVGQSNCYEADPTLTIQTTGSQSVTLNFNGVDTEFSPGTLLTITNSVCTIHRGGIIRGTGPNPAILLANSTVDIEFNDDGTFFATNARGISEREFERGQLIQNAINDVSVANGWAPQLVNGPAEFDEEPEPTSEGASPSDGEACAEQHEVVYGETLHSIAERYDTSVLSIAERNNIDNPRLIFAGSTLCIPEPGSGFEPLPFGL